MRKKTILLVDDERDFVEMIKLRLEANQYRVITAGSGKEALARIKRQKPDAVLLDILMPELDGLETLRRIRKQDRKLPVFILTAFSKPERFALARQFNASGFLVKTNDFTQELEHITAALQVAEHYRGTGNS